MLSFCHCCSVAESCLTLCDPMDCSPPDSVHGISQARILEWVAISFSRDLPNPGTELMYPALAGGFFTTKPPGKFLVLPLMAKKKGSLQDMIKLKILGWEDDPGLSGWIASPPGVNICSHTYSYKREAK